MLNITIYRNNKTNLIGSITRSNEETKRVTLTFEDGSEKELAISTLKDKRSYTPITDEGYQAMVVKETTKAVKAKKKGPKAKAKAVKENAKKQAKPRITISYNGQEHTPTEWGKILNLNPRYIRKQLRNGKAPEEIFGSKEGKNEQEK